MSKYSIPLSRPYIRKELVLKEIEKVLDSKWISGGYTISKFEDAIKEYNYDKDGYYIAVSNCTIALELALKNIIRKRFDNLPKFNYNVVVPSWSWVASGFSVINSNLIPNWCDINIYGVPYAEDIEKRIDKNTIAIMIVHQMGVPCDIDKIERITKKYNLPIIEDGACALGSEYKNKRIGNSNNIVTYSFQAKKVLTTGEGGMIITRNKDDAEWFQSIRCFGSNSTPLARETKNIMEIEKFDKVGGNYKISDINAAVGLAHLKYVDEEIILRASVAEYYNNKLNNNKYITVLDSLPDYCTRYNYQNYHILLSKNIDRNKVYKKMKDMGINCKWDIQATHEEPCIPIEWKESLKTTSLFHRQGLQLPFYAELNTDTQDIVIKELEKSILESIIW